MTRRMQVAALCGLLSVACAGPRQGFVTPRWEKAVASPSAAVERQATTFEGAGKLRLFEQSWRPHSEPRAVFVLVHGLKDHSSRYTAIAERLAEHGYAVHAFDLRGHGRSGGDRVFVNDFEDYVSDLDTFLARVRQQEPGRPIFLFGHSMGGAIVTLTTLERKPDVRGVILSAPALKPGKDVSPFLVSVTGFLGAVLPGLPVLDLDLRRFSRDPDVVRDIEGDMLVSPGPGPARTGAQLLSALGTIQRKMEDVTVPLLVLHGTADQITDPDGSRMLNERAHAQDKTLKLYDGLYHALLEEPEHDQVLADILQWLDAHAPQQATAARR